ncbi:hypothetical protein ACPESV_14915 [Streptomyces umbrinus]
MPTYPLLIPRAPGRQVTVHHAAASTGRSPVGAEGGGGDGDGVENGTMA